MHRMATIRKIYRWIILIILLIIAVIFTTLLLRNTIRPGHFSGWFVTKWLRAAAHLFGVNIKVYGTPLNTKTLFISNHISWLDILILGSLTPVHFLAKYEVKTMPVIGWLATRAGTLYIQRGNHRSASEACGEITAALKQNHNSLVFAEGTTTDGTIKKFHSRTLQSAIDAQAMLQPVAIFYPQPHPQTGQIEINPVVLFTGDTSMRQSADLIFRAACIDVEVHYLQPTSSIGKTREQLAQYAYREVAAAINTIKSG